jgi:protein O-mannosyl-transferase
MPGQIFSRLKDSFNKRHILIIIILTALVYLPASQGSFLFDDNYLIKDNSYIREGHSVSSYLSQEDGIADEIDKGVYHTGYYRPFTNFTYHFDYLLWGMNARGFRTTNIILHILNVLLLYLLINYLFLNKNAAFFSAMIFALHPANTEAISIIVNRNNLLAVLFFLLSFYFYLQSMEKEKNGLFVLSVFFFGLSVFSKEIGIMGIGVFFLYNRIISSNHGYETPNQALETDSKNRCGVLNPPLRFWNEFLSYLPYLLLIVVYVIMRSCVVGPSFTRLNLSDALMRIYYVPWLCCYNLLIILFPWKLHSFGVSYPADPAGIAVIASIIFFIAAVMAVVLFRKKYRMMAFSVAAFLLVLFPVLNVIPKASVSLVSLRWLYFPLIFIAVLIAFIIKSVKQPRQEMLFAVLITIICYLGAYGFMMNRYHWYNEKMFLTQEATAFNNELFMGAYAAQLYEQKKIDEAEKYYLRAIQAYPALPESYNGYALLLIVDRGRVDEASRLLKKAEKLSKTSDQRQEWLHMTGLVKIKRGEGQDALNYLFQALSIKQTPEIYNSIGLAYSALNEKEKALYYLRKGLELDAKNAVLTGNLKILSR